MVRVIQMQKRDFVRHAGRKLPPRHLRGSSPEFRDDNFYLRSAEFEARRLMAKVDWAPTTRLLDLGCGRGRLAQGFISIHGAIDYLGIDVHRQSIRWAKTFIEADHPSYRFEWMHVCNERYNPCGMRLAKGFQFDLPPRGFDVIYLQSVFSNMSEHDMRVYLEDFPRILAPGGHVYFTAYVEDDVPPVTINPPGYVFAKCSGPLHVVRYERTHLLALLDELGYTVNELEDHTEHNGQSALLLSRKTVVPGLFVQDDAAVRAQLM